MPTQNCRFRLLLAGAPLVLASCYVTPPQEINAKYKAVIEERQNQYRIKDGDTIEIRIRGLESGTDQTFVVLSDGRSDAWFLDNFRFEGLAVPEVEQALRQEMAEELDVEALDIAVQVRSSAATGTNPASGDVVYIFGQFEGGRVQTLPLRANMTVRDAIASLGGMSITGNTDYAMLRRSYLNPRFPDRFRVDLNDESEEIFLLPGDQLQLERTFLATVVAYLREYVFGIIPGQLYSVPLSGLFAF